MFVLSQNFLIANIIENKFSHDRTLSTQPLFSLTLSLLGRGCGSSCLLQYQKDYKIRFTGFKPVYVFSVFAAFVNHANLQILFCSEMLGSSSGSSCIRAPISINLECLYAFSFAFSHASNNFFLVIISSPFVYQSSLRTL